MIESKFLNKKNDKSNNRSPIKSFLIKLMLSTVVVLVVLIISKSNPKFKNYIKEKVFETNFSFASINKWYMEKFGNIIPVDNIIKDKEVSVFNEELKYSDAISYKDGVKLSVSSNYLVPVIQSGVVVFIGEKEEYGNVIIIQQVDGLDVWYGNINIGEAKMYDYIEKGSLLGEANDNYIFVAFQKDGNFLDYKDYI